VVVAHVTAGAELAGGQRDLQRDRGLGVWPQEALPSIGRRVQLGCRKTNCAQRIIGMAARQHVFRGGALSPPLRGQPAGQVLATPRDTAHRGSWNGALTCRDGTFSARTGRLEIGRSGFSGNG